MVDSTSAGNGTGAISLTSSISGLTPNTTYHYRAVAQNTRGTTLGADQTFGFPLSPPNGAAFHATNSGNFQARIYDDTGHLALAMPDLNGNPLSNIITFAPPSAKIGGASYAFGRIISTTAIANGLELTEAFAGTTMWASCLRSLGDCLGAVDGV